MNYVVIGPKGAASAVGMGVFGEIAEGRVANAAYIAPEQPRLIIDVARAGKIPFGIRRICQLPWEVRYSSVKCLLNTKGKNCVVFCPSTHPFERITPWLLRNLRKKDPDCRLVYYLVDGVVRTAKINHCAVEKVTGFLKRFDAVLTYDQNDASAYGYEYLDSPIWCAPDRSSPPLEYDVYFCGRNKGRKQLLEAVARRLDEFGVSSRFLFADNATPGLRKIATEDQPWKPYPEIVEEVKRSRCVLEVIAASNNGATLRYKEAVIYNKKLLTNNPEVSTLPYYDPRWMRRFEKPEDIDVEWLLRDEPVDYGYKGDFSTDHFLRQIEGVLKCKGLL